MKAETNGYTCQFWIGTLVRCRGVSDYDYD